MEEKSRKNPWLGLESYQEGEILYGRDDDIRDLTQSVLNDTDTLLYGKSGTMILPAIAITTDCQANVKHRGLLLTKKRTPYGASGAATEWKPLMLLWH